ncbi:MAG: tetratricopeptide repeat protein [Deltaproteobacteria bacterium]|nr:tetratricopeptide repeat protein [Deltaproteobacteria bacterium]
MLVEIRPGQDAPFVLVSRYGAKKSGAGAARFPLNGDWGRACDAGFIGIIQLFTPEPSGQAAQFVRLGEKALAEGDTATAVGRFSQADQAEPNNAVASRRIAQIYQQAGDAQTALDWYIRALNNAYVDPISALGAAGAAGALGNREWAIQYYQFAINAGLRIPMLYKRMGLYHFEEGRYGLVVQDLTDAYQLDPQDREILVPLVRSLEQEERFLEAANYQKILADAELTYENLAELAYLYERAEEYGRAAPVLRRLIESAPDDWSLRRRLAGAYEKSGKLDDARAVYNNLLTADPNDLASWLGLGRIEYAKRRYPEAVRALESARAIDPFDPATLRLLGMARELTDDIDAALTDYAEAIRWEEGVKNADVARYLALAKKARPRRSRAGGATRPSAGQEPGRPARACHGDRRAPRERRHDRSGDRIVRIGHPVARPVHAADPGAGRSLSRPRTVRQSDGHLPPRGGLGFRRAAAALCRAAVSPARPTERGAAAL